VISHFAVVKNDAFEGCTTTPILVTILVAIVARKKGVTHVREYGAYLRAAIHWGCRKEAGGVEKIMKLIKAADRISRHPIRSTILAAIAATLATITLVLASSGNSALAASSLVNGNFETGDLSGWTVDTAASGGAASAVTSYEDCSAPYECWYSRSYAPQEGSYFALLAPGKPSEATRISQPFTASNGDKVSGWAFFQTQYKEPWGAEPRYDAVGRVVLTDDSGKTVATLFEKRYSSGWTGWETRWTHWEHTFTGLTGTGTFQIEAQVQNTGERASECWGNLNYCDSVLGLDDVKTSTSTNDPDTTKPSTSATRSVEPNAAGWNKANVTVRLNATDNQGGSGVEKIIYSASGAQTIAQTDATGDSVEVALDQEGTTTLTYYATDKAANVEDKKTLTVRIDKSAPTGSVTINDGASRTRSRSVTLTLSATDPSPGSGVSQMRISNTESGLSSATWEAYSTTKAWSLSSGQGTKTVYVQYGDGAGNRSAVVTDTIRFAR
jgi:hypothetical protein